MAEAMTTPPEVESAEAFLQRLETAADVTMPDAQDDEYWAVVDAIEADRAAVRRAALLEAATVFAEYVENAERDHQAQAAAGDLDAAGRWADIRDGHDATVRLLRTLAEKAPR